MDYVQITADDHKRMLDAIGVANVDELYANLPPQLRLDHPLSLKGLPANGKSELELQRDLATFTSQNRPAASHGFSCFLGAGAYDHFIPTVVDAMAGQGAFVTAYTPYQAEASQGSLQAFFEFQTQICRLTGLEVANASLYEGATAVAEAILMALNTTGKCRVLVASSLHPHYLEVVRTYLADLPADLVEIPVQEASRGGIECSAIEQSVDQGKGDIACIVIQSPNVYGVIEDWEQLFATARRHQEGLLTVAVFNPMACGLFKRPGDCGADIAVGEGQPLGIPLQFGGPYLGLFAAKRSLIRKMPGRLVGQTHDLEGRRGFCLTLQTREQHIRGAKATSNICTNQGLLALRATIYLTAIGPRGLREVASQCFHKARHAARKIAALTGYSLAHQGEFFHEFVVNCPVPARTIIDAGRSDGIMPGVDCSQLGIGSADQLLIAVTEKRTAAEVEALVELLMKVADDES